MALKTIKEEFQNFVNKTSLKGSSRISQSKTPGLKIMWIVFLLSSVAFVIYNTYSLVVAYYSYPVNIFVKEYNIFDGQQFIDFIELYGPIFPDVTFCNLNSKVQDDKIMTHEEFQEHMENIYFTTDKTEIWNKTFGNVNIEEELYNKIWDRIFNYAYISSIDHGQLHDLSSKMNNLINDCKVRLFKNGALLTSSCEKYMDISQVYIGNYFNCFKISQNMNSKEHFDFIFGIIVVLYVNEHILHTGSFHNSQEDLGVKMFVNPYNVYPNNELQGFYVSPGFHTVIDLEYSAIKRIGRPHGNCIDPKDIALHDLHNETITYNAESCYFGCLQKYVVENCNCIMKDMPIMLGKWPGKYTQLNYCEKVYFENEKRVNLSGTLIKLFCVENTIEYISSECLKIANPHCSEIRFSHIQSQTKWPRKSSIFSFYRKHIHDKPYASKFQEYEMIRRMHANHTISNNETGKLLNNINVIENNFAKISVLDKQEMTYEYVTTAKLSRSILLSNLGGTLNLFVGVSLCFIFEVIEFLVKSLLILMDSQKM